MAAYGCLLLGAYGGDPSLGASASDGVTSFGSYGVTSNGGDLLWVPASVTW